jgi:hypothetical protein
MRADMFKVLVERPRRGFNDKSQGRIFRNDELAPAKLGMRAGYRSRKWLNENLAPLRRYLHSQIGRPWDKVYSEIRQTIDARSTVKQHVLLHLDWFVVINTRLIDGEVYACAGLRSVEVPVAQVSADLFVHPRTGLLLENRARRQAQRARAARQRAEEAKKAKEVDRRVLDERRQLHRIDGIWYLLELAHLPEPRVVEQLVNGKSRLLQVHGVRWDAVRLARVGRQHGHGGPARDQASNASLYGDPTLYAVSKRQLNSRELRRYKLRA